MKQYQVTIKGTADLLQNAFHIEGANEGAPDQKSVGKDYSGEWRGKIYLLEDGTIYQPEAHLCGCLIKAAVTQKVQGQRGKTYKDAVKGGVFIEPAFIPHQVNISEFEGASILTGPVPDGFKGRVYIDRRVVRIQRAGVVRYRPALVKGWTLSFILQVLDDKFRTDMLKAILDTAGQEVGIGDFRPRFGRFIVEHFEEI